MQCMLWEEQTMINVENVIFCKECETQLCAGEPSDSPWAVDGPQGTRFYCGHCGKVAETMNGREYLALESERKERQAALKAEAQRKRRNADARARYDARRSLGLKRTPYGWE